MPAKIFMPQYSNAVGARATMSRRLKPGKIFAANVRAEARTYLRTKDKFLPAPLSIID